MHAFKVVLLTAVPLLISHLDFSVASLEIFYLIILLFQRTSCERVILLLSKKL